MTRSNTLHPFCLAGLCILLLAGCAKTPAPEPLNAPEQVLTEPGSPSEALEQAISDYQPAQKQAASELALQRIHFAFDQYALSPEAQDILSANAAVLQTLPEMKIRIEGHCDDHGSDEYNLALGERRAQAVRAFLTARGIQPARLETISYGEEMPLDRSDNEMAWAKNRRAEFKVLN